jgi:hypothetical protein
MRSEYSLGPRPGSLIATDTQENSPRDRCAVNLSMLDYERDDRNQYGNFVTRW